LIVEKTAGRRLLSVRIKKATGQTASTEQGWEETRAKT